MRFCQTHWDRLRAAIDQRGLTPLVSQDGKAAAQRMAEEIEGTASDVSYDPLLDAHNMISHRALELGGLGMLTGDHCPVCCAVEHSRIGDGPDSFRDKAHVESHWIDGPADAVLEHVRSVPALVAMLGGTP